MKTLKVQQPVTEPFDADVDVDLYTDEQADGALKDVGVVDDEGPRSLTRTTLIKPPKDMKLLNEMMSLPSPSTSLPTGEHSCISMLNCALTKTSAGEADIPRSSSVNIRPSKESTLDGGEQPQVHSLQLEELAHGKKEADGKSCALRWSCHPVVPLGVTVDSVSGSDLVSIQSKSLRVSDVTATQNGSSTVMSTLVRSDEPKPKVPKAITYHECCNLAQLDPRYLCHSCCVFHSVSCRELEYCQEAHHMLKRLGVCECGKVCARKPLVLCRYCGKEYCSDCWYRTPVECTCGQTFDQSSSV